MSSGNYNGQYPYVAGTDDQCLPVDSEMQTQNTNYDYTTFTKARNCLCNECSCDWSQKNIIKFIKNIYKN